VSVTGRRRADRRLILILCLITFLANAANQPAPSLYPAVAKDFGISTALVGQISTVSNLSGIILTLILAPLSDAFGRKRLITVGILLTLVAGTASALSPSFGMLLLVRIIGGASWGGIMPSVYSLAAERFTGATRTIAIGWVTSTLSLGGIIANFSFTQIAQISSWRASVWVYVAWATLGVLILPRFLPADPPLARLPRGMLRSLFGSGLLLPFRHRATRALIASNVARTLHWSAMTTYIALLFSDVYGVNIAVIGYLSLVTSVGYLIGVNIASRLSPRFGPQRINVWSNTIGFPILVLETGLLAPLPIMLTLAMCYHICMGASYTTQQTLLLAVTPAGKGATGGVNSATVQAGGVFASIIGGVIIGTLGYRWLGPILGWSGLLAAYLVWRAVSVTAGTDNDVDAEADIAVASSPDHQHETAATTTGR
jgi:DHA1 family bicyclomycin/chloramphenicol resistance-like MFS transporter